MRGGQIKLFRFSGIQVYLHWTWFLVAIYEIQSRSGAYSSIGWNVLEYLCLFAIVTMHEFGHALACRSVGGTPDRIMLWPFGGVAYVSPPQRPGAMLWSIAAGPLVNVGLIPVLWIAPRIFQGVAGPDLAYFLHSIEWINGGLLIFNILPIYPLDGGQILRSLLWYPLGRARSLMAAAVIGLIGVAAVGVWALRTQDLWLIAISAYIAMNCWNGLKYARNLWRLTKIPRRAGYSCPSCHTAPPVGEYWLCANCRQPFDPFETAGKCPKCAHEFAQTVCIDCARLSPMPEWAAADAVAAR